MKSLRVHVDQALAELLHHRHRYGPPIDSAHAPPWIDVARKDEQVVIGCTQLGQQLAKPFVACWYGEDRLDKRAVGAASNPGRVRPIAERRAQRIDHDGLASPGLAGEHAEIGRPIDVQGLDDCEVADSELEEASALRHVSRAWRGSAGRSRPGSRRERTSSPSWRPVLSPSDHSRAVDRSGRPR